MDAVTRDPLIAAVAASLPDPMFGTRPALAESAQAKSPAAYKFVSAEYFSVLGIDLVRGRTFTASESSVNAGVAIVAESFAAADVARRQRTWRGAAARTRSGSARRHVRARTRHRPAVSRLSASHAMWPDLLLPRAGKPMSTCRSPSSHAETMLAVRVHGDPESARSALLERLTAVDPNIEQIVTLKTVAGMATYFLQMAFWLTLVLGGLALTLTLSGVFSVHVVSGRATHERNRRAHGAGRDGARCRRSSCSVKPPFPSASA